jgi:hypothetical protein
MSKMLDYIRDHVLEPTLQWILAYPIPTLLAIAILVLWVGQSYKTRIK